MRKSGIAGIFILVLLTGYTFRRRLGGVEPYKLEYPAHFGSRINIPADNPLTKEGVYLGRMLFYEKRLSGNDQLSCENCHQQQFAFTDGRALSEGIDHSKTRRNSMSLVNLLWGKEFFWDGRAASLEEQAVTPLTDQHEMGQSLERSAEKLRRTTNYPGLFKAAFGSDSITGRWIVKAIAQFERTLISANSPYDLYLEGRYQPTVEESNGMALFSNNPSPERNIRGAGCAHCHGGPKTFMGLFHNNGLDSLPKDEGREAVTGQAADRGRFRVPTLRNIALTAPYMHDGRFATLDEVLDHYNEHIQNTPLLSPVLRDVSNVAGGKTLGLTVQEKQSIIAFLRMLTDSSFINDTRFSNPHSKH